MVEMTRLLKGDEGGGFGRMKMHQYCVVIWDACSERNDWVLEGGAYRLVSDWGQEMTSCVHLSKSGVSRRGRVTWWQTQDEF